MRKTQGQEEPGRRGDLHVDTSTVHSATEDLVRHAQSERVGGEVVAHRKPAGL